MHTQLAAQCKPICNVAQLLSVDTSRSNALILFKIARLL